MRAPTKPLIVVEWDDASCGADEVVDPENVTHAPAIITTIGWEMKNDEVGITLCNEYYDKLFRGRTFIPRAMIRSVTPYKLSRPRGQAKPNLESSPP